MANYTKTTDFAAKDTLPGGDSNKVVRGSEFETEFDAISKFNYLENIKNSSVEKPIFLHCITKKGKGYEPAEKSNDKFHGVNKFDVRTGPVSYTHLRAHESREDLVWRLVL